MPKKASNARLSRPVDDARDRTLGPQEAQITLVEYGSYDCPYCRAVNDHIVKIRHEFGDRLRYVFRHYPLPGSKIALRAAVLAALLISFFLVVGLEIKREFTVGHLADKRFP